ncbi:Protein-tyrosine sulfotransferase [Platanthera zijinensis]|uniref:Protein-tyrosine sulfotransferase n=1 Tax=Platanthera zijinensis TaxID=2320716 RepID=A0AAP0G4A6_9ASPA
MTEKRGSGLARLKERVGAGPPKGAVSTSALAFKGDDFSYCESIVRKWAESSTNNRIKEDKLTLKDLLFFLHVPRTGGRSYYHCFLKKLYVNIDECPRSYDKLRFDPRESKCRLLVTHDDYSLVSKLSNDKTSVRDARKYAAVRSFNGTINPYDMNGLVMPLHSFVDDPMAHEIIHNGATFQRRWEAEWTVQGFCPRGELAVDDLKELGWQLVDEEDRKWRMWKGNLRGEGCG